MAKVWIGMLGTVIVRVQDDEVEVGGAIRRALLARLAIAANTTIGRTTLFNDIWPDREAPPLGTLQSYMTHLRQALGSDHFPRVPGGYQIALGGEGSDVSQFSARLDRGRTALGVGDPSVAELVLTDALSLWRGEALSEFVHLPWAMAFSTALVEERRHAEVLLNDAQMRLGKHAAIIPRLKQQTHAAPYAEQFWYQLMLCQYRAGNHHAALEAFAEAREALIETGLDPSPTLRELERAILIHDPDLMLPRNSEDAAFVDNSRAAANRLGELGTTENRLGELGTTENRLGEPRPAVVAGNVIEIDGDTANAPENAAALSRVDAATDAQAAIGFSHIYSPGIEERLRERPWLQFVGRESEIEQITAAVGARRPGPTLIDISGEQGAGKTRLLLEASTRWRDRGILPIVGRCESVRRWPYEPLVDLLQAVETDHRQVLVNLSDQTRADLAWLLPSAASDDEQSTLGVLDGQARRYRLASAIAEVVSALCSAGPLVYVIDDVHWADHETFEVLRHLLQRRQLNGLTVIVSHRPLRMGVGVEPSLSEVTNGLESNDRLTRVELKGLRRRDVVALLVRAGFGNADEVGDAIHARTDGNALFSIEMLRRILTQFREDRPFGDPSNLVIDPSALPLPRNVLDIVARRLVGQPAELLALLRAAAILGSPFDGELVREAAQLSQGQMSAAVEVALAEDFIREDPLAVDRYSFSHAVYRESVLAGMAAGVRARLHKAAFDVLAGEGDHVGVRVQRSLHALNAGPLIAPAVVIDELRQAAATATAHLAFETAEDLLRKALAHAEAAIGQTADDVESDQTNDPFDLERPRTGRDIDVSLVRRFEPIAEGVMARLHLELGTTINLVGDVREAKTLLSKCAELAEELDEADLFAAAALEYGGPIPAGHEESDPRAIQLLRDAVASPQVSDVAIRARLLARLAQASYWLADSAERARLVDQATALLNRVDTPADRLHVMMSCYWALTSPTASVVLDDLVGRIAAEAHLVDNDELLLRSSKCLIAHALARGDVERARRVHEGQTQRLRRVRHPEFVRLSLAVEASFALLDGDVPAAEERARDARRILRERGQVIPAMVAYTVQLLPIRWFSGRLSDHVDYLVDTVSADPGRPLWLGSLAWAAVEEQRFDVAANALAQIDVDLLKADEKSMDWYLVVCGMAVAANRLGDTEIAERCLNLLDPHAHALAVVGQVAIFGAVAHFRGLCLATLKMHEQARVCFEEAVEYHERIGALPHLAMSRVELAAALNACGRSKEADICSAAALKDAVAYHLGGVLQRVNQLGLDGPHSVSSG
jgi:DNA-binding SARP family transcriptional activator